MERERVRPVWVCLFTYPGRIYFLSMGMDAQLSAAIAGYWAKVKPHNPEEELVVTATPTQTAVRLEPITQRYTPSCQSRSAYEPLECCHAGICGGSN